MKFYIYEKNLLHECKGEFSTYYDNLYLIKKDTIYCNKCFQSAPISIILGFKTRLSTNKIYTIIGERSLYLILRGELRGECDTKILSIINGLKSLEI